MNKQKAYTFHSSHSTFVYITSIRKCSSSLAKPIPPVLYILLQDSRTISKKNQEWYTIRELVLIAYNIQWELFFIFPFAKRKIFNFCMPVKTTPSILIPDAFLFSVPFFAFILYPASCTVLLYICIHIIYEFFE